MIDTWPLPCAVLLSRTGHPDLLEAQADRLERLAATSDDETNSARMAAVQELRQLADAARVCMGELERMGCRFNFKKGCAVLVKGGKGGPKHLLSVIIPMVLADLDPSTWHDRETLDRIRAELHVTRDELSDKKIKNTIGLYAGADQAPGSGGSKK